MFSIALLDRLIIMNFPLNSKTQELLAATLVLLSTKMNEIYPISVRRLNSLLKKDTGYSVEQFTMMEGLVLKQLDFNLNVEDTVHNGIAILVNKQNKAYALFVESIVKTFIKSVEMFQQGSDALLVAI